jgi:FkbM family methyltransferase
MAFDRIKEALRLNITRYRRTRVVASLALASRFVIDAYHNNNTEALTNGELALVERLKQFDFKIAFDVGANVGNWCVHAASQWTACQIHAFEVLPDTAKVLSERVAASPCAPRITVHAIGASDMAGEATLYAFPGQSELTTDRPRFDGARPFTAMLVRLDDFAAEHAVSRIGFVKIDVEGAEYAVIKGLSRLIEADAIDVIQFEYGAFWIDSRRLLRDFFDLLHDRYWMGEVFPTGVSFSEYTWTNEDVRFRNILCVSRRRADIRSAVLDA